jgi:predicted nucleotidyltransferase
MDEKSLAIVERFKRLVAERVKIDEIRVFGSRARSDAAEDSDLDVLVIVERLDRDTERYISDCAWEAGFPDDVIVVPIVLSRDAVENSPLRESGFLKNVYRESVAV